MPRRSRDSTTQQEDNNQQPKAKRVKTNKVALPKEWIARIKSEKQYILSIYLHNVTVKRHANNLSNENILDLANPDYLQAERSKGVYSTINNDQELIDLVKKQSSTLQALVLTCYEFANEDTLEQIAQNSPNLTVLYLTECKFKNNTLKKAAQYWTKLVAIDLFASKVVTDEDIKCIAQANKDLLYYREPQFYLEDLTPEHYHYLAENCTKLQVVEGGHKNSFNDQSCKYLSNCKQLVKVTGNPDITIEGVKALKESNPSVLLERFPSSVVADYIRTTESTQTVPILSLNMVEKLDDQQFKNTLDGIQGLTDLDISGQYKLTEGAYDYLAQKFANTLTSLNVSQNALNDSQVQQLYKLTNLQRLDISFNDQMFDPAVKEDATWIGLSEHLQKLTFLDLSWAQVSIDALEKIVNNLKELKHLRLIGCNGGDDFTFFGMELYRVERLGLKIEHRPRV
jgi:hypothetical protein